MWTQVTRHTELSKKLQQKKGVLVSPTNLITTKYQDITIVHSIKPFHSKIFEKVYLKLHFPRISSYVPLSLSYSPNTLMYFTEIFPSQGKGSQCGCIVELFNCIVNNIFNKSNVVVGIPLVLYEFPQGNIVTTNTTTKL
jgi:hypothetical protein